MNGGIEGGNDERSSFEEEINKVDQEEGRMPSWLAHRNNERSFYTTGEAKARIDGYTSGLYDQQIAEVAKLRGHYLHEHPGAEQEYRGLQEVDARGWSSEERQAQISKIRNHPLHKLESRQREISGSKHAGEKFYREAVEKGYITENTDTPHE